ncbi:uncharacterized protein LOC142331003 [Lycorma delicatula]|uniref:uncharacterized protein LOC142331003 n=1 Tax=Lycorma delicatula TaxID=130591 RepID=UPI003F50EC4A
MAYQRQNWQTNESGILRKKDENEEELLVFGYSCKLFRDDEKALYIDQGKHLIPWMGDDSLRIDRYDVRGALYDLTQYEAISGHQEELFWINLSNEERRIEQLCDEERYRALTHNEDEEALYQEEELKRLHQALGSDKTYGQVSYSYEEENGESEKPVQESNQTDDSDEPFIAPPELDVPEDMVLPETVKLNAIIEKTAIFIIQQGSQMEIILKMKQASNPQFEFLSYHSALHGYYRHVLMAIKSGRYRPKVQNSSTDSKSNEENTSDQNYYLHHSLSQAPTSSFNLAPSIPSINYKPSTDCAYSMLVNKIRGNQNKFNLLNKVTETKESTVIPEKNVKENKIEEPDMSSKNYSELEVPDESDEEHNDSEKSLKPSSPLPVITRSGRRKRRKRQQGAFAYNDSFNDESVDGAQFETAQETELPHEVSSEQGPEVDSTLQLADDIPPADLQLIIDKMASYVAKNGRDFEEIVRSKDDPRFYFLDTTNPYYNYYRKKVEYFEQLEKPVENVNEDSNSNTIVNINTNVTTVITTAVTATTTTTTAANSSSVENNDKIEEEKSVKNGDINKNKTVDDKKQTTHKPNPVCFSIKRPKECEGLEIKSALPIEESSEDEEGGGGDDGGGSNDKEVSDNTKTNNETVDLSEELNTNVKNNIDKGNTSNSVTEKWAEERVKDKLAAAAREKLVSKEREKQLQLERKRRAAAFLNLIQKSNKKPSLSPEKSQTQPIMIGPQLPDDFKNDEKSDSDGVQDDNDGDNDNSDSVSSPPSSVTSPEVTIIGESTITNSQSPKRKDKELKLTESLSSSHKLKHSKHSVDKYEHNLRSRSDVEFRHKHRKRKRSRSPVRRHHSTHSSRTHYHSSHREGKHRKHHRHRKDRHHSDRDRDRDYNSSLHRRHKHYKSKKHKRRDDKKYIESSSSDDSDSE